MKPPNNLSPQQLGAFYAEKDMELGLHSDHLSTTALPSNLKTYLKNKEIKNLEPAIIELLIAHHIRKNRNSNFEGSTINDDDVPQYIGSIIAEINHRLSSIPYQGYEIGGLLHTAKKILGHGNFGDWIEKSLPISYSSALNFMRVYRNCLGCPDIIDFFKKSVLYEICTPSFPDDFRSIIFENIDGPIDVNKKELLEIAVKWKKGEVTPKSPEVQNLLKKQRFKSEAKVYIEELESLLRHLKSCEKIIMAMNTISDPHPFLNEEDNEKNKTFIEIGNAVQKIKFAVERRIKILTEEK